MSDDSGKEKKQGSNVAWTRLLFLSRVTGARTCEIDGDGEYAECDKPTDNQKAYVVECEGKLYFYKPQVNAGNAGMRELVSAMSELRRDRLDMAEMTMKILDQNQKLLATGLGLIEKTAAIQEKLTEKLLANSEGPKGAIQSFIESMPELMRQGAPMLAVIDDLMTSRAEMLRQRSIALESARRCVEVGLTPDEVAGKASNEDIAETVKAASEVMKSEPITGNVSPPDEDEGGDEEEENEE
jgi:hypothetical protein